VQVPIQFRWIARELASDQGSVNRWLTTAFARAPLYRLIDLNCLQGVDAATLHTPESTT
jgi:hypothetical protein